MKIKKILAYRVELPLHEGSYKWSGGKSVTVFDSTVVRVETDSGLVGYGEVCPLGPAYLPAYAGGVRAGLAELAPRIPAAQARVKSAVWCPRPRPRPRNPARRGRKRGRGRTGIRAA